MRRLPPLASLLAFEAAARLGSFLGAADELHLTPSAISHRVKSLEQWLGVRLFVRQTRRIALTAEGQAYVADVRAALDRLEQASARAGRPRRQALRISVAPALGAKWLAPQLHGFRKEQPGIELRLSSATGLDPVIRGDADVGIRYGRAPWPGLACRKLRDETLVVVCSPALLIADRRSAADWLAELPLLRHPLLDWHGWFEAAAIRPPPVPDGPAFDDAMLMLEAAAGGAGAALIVASLAESYLAAGTLIEPFPGRAPGKAYYAIASRDNLARAEVQLLVRWLQARAR